MAFKKRFFFISKKLILISLVIVIIFSLLITSLFYIDNDKLIFKDIYMLKNGKQYKINNFQSLSLDGKPGPITINREEDDGTKINLYSFLEDIPKENFKDFYFGKGNFTILEDTIKAEEEYICEDNYKITKNGIQGVELKCPSFYHIKINSTFYGRYAGDGERCEENFKPEYAELKENCSSNVTEIVKPICENHNSCILRSTKAFSDPCQGIHKYLHVKYSCKKDIKIKKPKIAVVMFADNIRPNSIYEHSINEFYQYCDIHGYHFILNENNYDKGRDIFYMKLHVITEALIEGLKTEKYDWIFWVDGDVVLSNPRIRLETFLPTDPNIHFLASSDYFGLNAGIFFLRVNSWSLNFISRSIAYQYYNSTDTVRFADQTSMNSVLIRGGEEDHYTIVPRHWFNIYIYDKNKGDFLVHFAGRDDKENESSLFRKKVYKNKNWINYMNNKILREEVLQYYNLPKQDQEKIWLPTDWNYNH